MIKTVFRPVFRSSLFRGIFPIAAATSVFSPLDLFSSGSQGIWLDPSDLSTMFQGSIGTVPVASPGDPVGLRFDKSKGLEFGPDIITNGDFATDTDWSLGTGWSIGGGVASATAAASGQLILQVQTEYVTGRWYAVTFTIVSVSAGGFSCRFAGVTGATRSTTGTFTDYFLYTGGTQNAGVRTVGTTTGTIDNIIVKELPGNHASQALAGSRLTYGIEPKTGTRNILLATDTMATQTRTVTAVAHTLAFTGTGTVTLTGASIAGPLVGTGAGNRVSLTFTPTAGSLTLTVLGSVTLAQLEIGSTATAYQRVTTAFDVTEAGVPSCHYVQYDGTDDSMSTGTIDFTLTDAMSVFAGVWKRTDAALGNLLELSVDAVNTAGTFAMRAPNTTASAAYSYLSRGTALAQAATPTTFPAPRYNLVSGLSDISVDQCVIRVNGTQATSSASDQGSGNYGNHSLFIGRRNNTNLPFAGRDYGIIIVGKAVSAGDLASTEAWLADKTPGVTL